MDEVITVSMRPFSKHVLGVNFVSGPVLVENLCAVELMLHHDAGSILRAGWCVLSCEVHCHLSLLHNHAVVGQLCLGRSLPVLLDKLQPEQGRVLNSG